MVLVITELFAALLLAFVMLLIGLLVGVFLSLRKLSDIVDVILQEFHEVRIKVLDEKKHDK